MNYTYSDELYHFGIRGMKWGVRRYQNEDGTLTEEGRIHYGRVAEKGLTKRSRDNAALMLKTDSEYKEYQRKFDETLKRNKKYRKDFKDVSKMPENTKEERAAKIKAQDKFFDDLIKVQEAEEVHHLSESELPYLLSEYGDKKISELTDFYNSDNFRNASDIAGDFYDRSVKESGDWYHQVGISDNFKRNVEKAKKTWTDYDKVNDEIMESYKKQYPEDNGYYDWKKVREIQDSNAEYQKLKKKLNSIGKSYTDIVIKDLGYIPTKKARKALDPLIRWD